MTLEELTKLVEGWKVYDLSHTMHRGMPQFPFDSPFIFTQTVLHGNRIYEGNISVASELVCLTGHTGTHIDGLGHIAKDGKLFGGIDPTNIQGGFEGLRELGIETRPANCQEWRAARCGS